MANKKATYGRFDVTGIVKGLGQDSIVLDARGKNNVNWIMNKLNVRLDDGTGNSFFMNVTDGYSAVNGKDIYVQDQNGGNITIPFADRLNEIVLQQVNPKSFIKVGYGLGEIEKDGKKFTSWLYKEFLTAYDVIRYLKDVLQDGMKVTFNGNLGYNTYNGETQLQYNIQRVYIEPKELPEGFTPRECKFNFTQTILLDSDSVDDSKFEESNLAKIKAYIYTLTNKKDASGKNIKVKDENGKMINAKEPKVFPIDFVVRATDEKKDVTRKVIDKYLKVTDEDVVRKITFIGRFIQGFVGGSITEDDLSADIKEMIEEELYTLEEALKMYATRERVSEKQLVKPDLPKVDGKPTLDMDDKTYDREDLTFIVDSEEKVVRNVPTTSNIEEDDLLSELDDL